MKISPRISGESGFVTCGCGTAVLVPSTMALGGDCAAADQSPAARNSAKARPNIRAHPLGFILVPVAQAFKPGQTPLYRYPISTVTSFTDPAGCGGMAAVTGMPFRIVALTPFCTPWGLRTVMWYVAPRH